LKASQIKRLSAFIPDRTPDADPITAAEGVAVDQDGNVYGAVVPTPGLLRDRPNAAVEGRRIELMGEAADWLNDPELLRLQFQVITGSAAHQRNSWEQIENNWRTQEKQSSRARRTSSPLGPPNSRAVRA
jgi:hypothetical protein